jgi:hypothetical protein
MYSTLGTESSSRRRTIGKFPVLPSLQCNTFAKHVSLATILIMSCFEQISEIHSNYHDREDGGRGCKHPDSGLGSDFFSSSPSRKFFPHRTGPWMRAPRSRDELNVQAASAQLTWIRSSLKPRLCPKCQSNDTRRSKRRGFLELGLLGLLPVLPFRCKDCDWRFYGWLFSVNSIRSKMLTNREPNP